MRRDHYAFANVLKTRKVEGKDKMEYLVNWDPTWVNEKHVDAKLIDDYHMSVDVLGPIDSDENLQKSSITDMDLILSWRRKNNMTDEDEIILELMPYEQVKKLHPVELYTYLESTFSVSEKLRKMFEEDPVGGKQSAKKEKPRKRKLSQ